MMRQAQIASAMFIDSKIKEFWLRRCAIGNIGMQALRDALMFNKVPILPLFSHPLPPFSHCLPFPLTHQP